MGSEYVSASPDQSFRHAQDSLLIAGCWDQLIYIFDTSGLKCLRVLKGLVPRGHGVRKGSGLRPLILGRIRGTLQREPFKVLSPLGPP